MVEDLFDLPPAARIAFSDPGQFRGAVVTELARIYEEARRREPRLSQFDNLADAVAEYARAVGLYWKPRHFGVIELKRRIAAIKIGKVVEIDYQRWGFASGARALVYLVGVAVGSNKQKLGIWY